MALDSSLRPVIPAQGPIVPPITSRRTRDSLSSVSRETRSSLGSFSSMRDSSLTLTDVDAQTDFLFTGPPLKLDSPPSKLAAEKRKAAELKALERDMTDYELSESLTSSGKSSVKSQSIITEDKGALLDARLRSVLADAESRLAQPHTKTPEDESMVASIKYFLGEVDAPEDSDPAHADIVHARTLRDEIAAVTVHEGLEILSNTGFNKKEGYQQLIQAEFDIMDQTLLKNFSKREAKNIAMTCRKIVKHLFPAKFDSDTAEARAAVHFIRAVTDHCFNKSLHGFLRELTTVAKKHLGKGSKGGYFRDPALVTVFKSYFFRFFGVNDTTSYHPASAPSRPQSTRLSRTSSVQSVRTESDLKKFKQELDNAESAVNVGINTKSDGDIKELNLTLMRSQVNGPWPFNETDTFSRILEELSKTVPAETLTGLPTADDLRIAEDFVSGVTTFKGPANGINNQRLALILEESLGRIEEKDVESELRGGHRVRQNAKEAARMLIERAAEQFKQEENSAVTIDKLLSDLEELGEDVVIKLTPAFALLGIVNDGPDTKSEFDGSPLYDIASGDDPEAEKSDPVYDFGDQQIVSARGSGFERRGSGSQRRESTEPSNSVTASYDLADPFIDETEEPPISDEEGHYNNLDGLTGAMKESPDSGDALDNFKEALIQLEEGLNMFPSTGLQRGAMLGIYQLTQPGHGKTNALTAEEKPGLLEAFSRKLDSYVEIAQQALEKYEEAIELLSTETRPEAESEKTAFETKRAAMQKQKEKLELYRYSAELVGRLETEPRTEGQHLNRVAMVHAIQFMLVSHIDSMEGAATENITKIKEEISEDRGEELAETLVQIFDDNTSDDRTENRATDMESLLKHAGFNVEGENRLGEIAGTNSKTLDRSQAKRIKWYKGRLKTLDDLSSLSESGYKLTKRKVDSALNSYRSAMMVAPSSTENVTELNETFISSANTLLSITPTLEGQERKATAKAIERLIKAHYIPKPSSTDDQQHNSSILRILEQLYDQELSYQLSQSEFPLSRQPELKQRLHELFSKTLSGTRARHAMMREVFHAINNATQSENGVNEIIEALNAIEVENDSSYNDLLHLVQHYAERADGLLDCFLGELDVNGCTQNGHLIGFGSKETQDKVKKAVIREMFNQQGNLLKGISVY